MKLKKICALFLVLVLCFSVVSCAGNHDEKPGDSTSDTGGTDTGEGTGNEDDPGGQEVPEVKKITIAEGGKVYYSLIYYSEANDVLRESISALHTNIVSKSGASFMDKMSDESVDDSNKDQNAILIGNTVCAESAQVMEEIGIGDWKVCFVKNKLVVAGSSQESLEQAITALIQKIKAETVDGVIALPEDLNLTGTSDEIANALPRYEGGHLAGAISEGQQTYLVVMEKTNAEEYTSYLSKLQSAGWTFYTSNQMVENRFATYYNNDYVINAGYYAYENAVRITIEKKNHLQGLASDNVYTKNPDVISSIAQMGLSTEESNYVENGMAYAIQLADGSFIVVDGGYYRDSPRLYNYLKKMAPEGKIVIAAWILTHNDGDHRQCINAFTTAYRDEVKIEQIIMNFPSAYTHTESGTSGDISTEIAANSYPGCKRIKAHTGHKYYIRNAEVEILYSIDSYLPTPLKIFNNSSLVFTVDVDGDRIIFLGDAGNAAFGIINPMYGNYLKSDIVQLSHHGLRNGTGLKNPNTEQAYKYIQASVVLWPTGEREYLNVAQKEKEYQMAGFSWNLAATEAAREVFIAGDSYQILNLPYREFTARKVMTPNELDGMLQHKGSQDDGIHVSFKDPDKES